MKKYIFNIKLLLIFLIPFIQMPSFQVIQVYQLNDYTIEFESNGGSPLESISGKYGTLIDLPTPDKDTHRFFGWYFDENFEQTVPDSFKMPFQNITLYARWKYSGLGSEFMPIEIQSNNDIELLRNTTFTHFELINDIDLGNDFSTIDSFSGHIDGNGYGFNIKDQPMFQSLESEAVIENLLIGFDGMSSLALSSTGGSIGLFANHNQGVMRQIEIDYLDGTLTLSSSSSNMQYVGFVGLNEGNMNNIALTNSDLIVTRQTGLFGFGSLVGINTGTIQDITNHSVNVVGTSINLGGIVGISTASGTLENLTNHGNLRLEGGIQNRDLYIGGVAYGLESDAHQLSNTGSIELYSNVSYPYAGGIAGYAYSEDQTIRLSNVINDGLVQAHNPINLSSDYIETSIGGIVAFASKNVTISRAMNTGNISNLPKLGTSTRNYQSIIGGIVGANEAIISESFNSGNMVLSDEATSNLGGLTGYTFLGKISSSYNLGSITSHNQTSTSWIGGISGWIEGAIIEDIYHRGNITVTNNSSQFISVVGGLVGDVYASDNPSVNPTKIQRGYASGTIAGPSNTWIGGIVGKNNTADSIVTKTHFFKTASIINGIGRNQNNSSSNAGTTSYTSKSNMYNLANALGNEWENINNELPQLKWQDE
jgi:uncharacterized repeat protein (TIGR02543 family)